MVKLVINLVVFKHIDEEVMNILCFLHSTHLSRLHFKHLGDPISGFKVVVVLFIDPLGVQLHPVHHTVIMVSVMEVQIFIRAVQGKKSLKHP